MWSGWSRRWRELREARAIARRPVPDDLWRRTLNRYPFLRRRDPGDEILLRRLVSLFLDRKEFSAAGRIRLTNALHVFKWESIGFAGMIADTKKAKADLRPIADVDIPAGAEVFCVPVPDGWGL